MTAFQYVPLMLVVPQDEVFKAVGTGMASQVCLACASRDQPDAAHLKIRE